MPLMKLNKNRVFASTTGHAIRFVKDEPVNVPLIAVKDCEAIGAIFESENEKPEDHVNEDEIADQVAASINSARNAEGMAPPPKQPTAPVDRIGDVVKAVKVIQERNERNDFTANGRINLKALAKEVGYRVDKSELTEAMDIINDPD